jgi:pimeloyl-ACP methyl ester carboxylesterase
MAPLRFDVTEHATMNDRTMILVHGWPDTAAVFAAQCDHFAATHRVVVLSLPGYLRGGAGLPAFGHHFDAVVEALRATIVDVMQGHSGKPVVVAHDWGAHFVFMVERKHPELFDRIVGLDVAGHVGPKRGTQLLFLLAYQWLLVLLYLLPRVAGTPLTRLFAKHGLGAPDAPAAHAGMSYLYLRQWVSLLTGDRAAVAPRWQAPAVPVLFMYGTKMPVYFHSKKWAEHLAATDGSAIVAIDGGHWFYRGRHAADVNQRIAKFASE